MRVATVIKEKIQMSKSLSYFGFNLSKNSQISTGTNYSKCFIAVFHIFTPHNTVHIVVVIKIWRNDEIKETCGERRQVGQRCNKKRNLCQGGEIHFEKNIQIATDVFLCTCIQIMTKPFFLENHFQNCHFCQILPQKAK